MMTRNPGLVGDAFEVLQHAVTALGARLELRADYGNPSPTDPNARRDLSLIRVTTPDHELIACRTIPRAAGPLDIAWLAMDLADQLGRPR